MFKARGMRGVDDRQEFYRFWYNAWDMQSQEAPLKGWWAIPMAESKISGLFQAGGNLVLTSKRLLWEPMTGTRRAVYAPYGMKIAINLMAKAQEAVSPRVALMWQLDGLTLDRSDGSKIAVFVSVTGDDRVGFYFAIGPLQRGSELERKEFIETVTAEQLRSRASLPE